MLNEAGAFLSAIEHKYLDKRTAYGYAMIIGDAINVVNLIRDGMIFCDQKRPNRQGIEAGLEPIIVTVPGDD